MPTVSSNSYGKSRIRLVKVVRRGDRHDLKDLTVNVRLEGEFDSAFVEGDNRLLLPTDTLKNTVYVMARSRPFDEIEEFGLALCRYFLAEHRQLSRARIEVHQRLWNRVPVGAKLQGHAFSSAPEGRTAVITSNGERVAVVAGLENLPVLKTSGATFEGFLRDTLTTLRPDRERILSTTLSARWTYLKPEVTFGSYWQGVRQALLETFVQHESRSLHHTLFAMADVVLSSYEEIGEVTISLPSSHHQLADLSPFGLENPDEIFVATDEPYALIEATVTRD
jgi:urate oxidase